jgi:glyceraldehyde 3-phosphate dehydrogenase
MAKHINVAINGFGRIGRIFTRLAFENSAFKIVAINSRSRADIYSHLLKYDSIYGPWEREVTYEENNVLVIDGHKIPLHHEDELVNAPWKEYDVDVVIEATGVFRDRETSEQHIKSGAKHVLITAPAKDMDGTFMYGMNHELFDPKKHKIVSSASCTTTCLAPVVKVLHDNFGVKHGNVLTAHAYTNDQHLVDHPHRKDDYRRSRAASLSIVPTATGAAKAITKIIPELAGKLDGMAVRVPVEIVSVIHFVAELEKEVTVKEVNSAYRMAAKEKYKKNLAVSDLPLVSVDHTKSKYGSIVDSLSTQVVDGTQVSVLSWYDNEWGYVTQMANLLEHMGEKIKSSNSKL